MSEQSVRDRVKKIIIKELGVNEEQVTDTASFLDDLGADSLATVELVMTLEEEFKNEIQGDIPDADAEKLKTVGDVVTYIEDKSKA